MKNLTITTKGGHFGMAIKAAHLVSEIGTAGLPPPIDTCALEDIWPDMPHVGSLLPRIHPLQQVYPKLKVIYKGLIVEDRFFVERNGVRGIALYCDFNSTYGLVAAIHSWNGRNALAPFSWEGKPGSETDPAAQPKMEWRPVQDDDGVFYWQDYMVHGYRDGLDWLDGGPDKLKTMHEPDGKVRQVILVPKELEGYGVAEQTMQASEVSDFLSVLMFDPTDEGLALHNRTQQRSYDYSAMEGAKSVGSTRGASRGAAPAESMAVEVPVKVAAGGFIRQKIRRDLYGPGFWNTTPSQLLVIVPISQQVAAPLFGSHYAGRKSF